MLPLVLAILLTAGAQAPAVDRSHAESLARSGRTAEAIAAFERIVKSNPADIEAQLSLARLFLRAGRTAEAEAAFRAVSLTHPNDVDARIGLGMALTRRGAWQDALVILREVEPAAGENADAFGALARAYRRGGDDQQALEYFRRARALSPNDPDLVTGFEAVARTYGHWLSFEGFAQDGGPGTRVTSGTVAANARVWRRLHLEALGRVQQGPDYSDATGGAGFRWRMARPTTIALLALSGPDNIAMARSDLSLEVIRYAGPFEIGGSVRRLAFAGANVSAASPLLAWTPVDAWRVDGRYTYSRAAFDETSESAGDHSVMLRTTWQGWRRVAALGTYAYGIESFEDLTADRIAALDATTMAGGVRLDLRSLTRITTTWEHQWRSNSTAIDRLTVTVTQAIP
jgi:cytochrome c-type biogenesis protein CcmH/NrfG